ncbi:MAG TPA: Cof-type HAD-IIB family hydrolase [Anaerolineae bacterium]|mgnify:CR=1 FL=1|nr:Cof-type HAD-IIB family hydrolase [Anaerolineae bacterium]HQH39535.1 Cof-type HAD-IIB family hydrolase [Anaerolineae bacterium]
MIRLAAFDLDGTLMGADQKIRPRVRQAVAQAQEEGVIVTLATGRMLTATERFARELNVTAPLLCYQGGWIQALDGPLLRRIALPTALAREAIELGTAEGWHTLLYARGQLFIQEYRHPVAFYDALLGSGVPVGESWDDVLAAHDGVDKVLYVAEAEQIPAMASVLQCRFAGRAAIVRSHAMFIEVVPSGVDKGSAVAWLAQYFGVPRDAVLAAGDQENDLTMIQWAGIGVAMGNAPPAVQEVADWIAPPVTEDGAAAILERFVFHRSCL